MHTFAIEWRDNMRKMGEKIGEIQDLDSTNLKSNIEAIIWKQTIAEITEKWKVSKLS